MEGFGRALRKMRREAGLNQRDLAAAAGYHQATISAVERTERIPGIDVLLGACRAHQSLGYQTPAEVHFGC